MKRTITVKTEDLNLTIQLNFESKRELTKDEKERALNTVTDFITEAICIQRHGIPYHPVHYKDITVR